MFLSDELPYIQVPLHTVVKLSPVAYGCMADFISLHIPAVDTYRPKPPVCVTLVRSLQTCFCYSGDYGCAVNIFSHSCMSSNRFIDSCSE